MMKVFSIFCFVIVALFGELWSAGSLAAPTYEAPMVILLSMDGVRYDYPDLREYPAFARMQRNGVRAPKLIAGWPSSTFPGHVTLATGAWADHHGIVDNRFYDRVRKTEYAYGEDANWIDAEPLWIAVERQGVKAATYFWVGSDTPWHGQHQSYRIAPFDGTVPESRKVDQIIAWMDLPAAKRPGLIMSYWHGTDRMGHEKGPDHPDIAVQLADQDAQLARIINAIDTRHAWSRTTLIVVSDHGMTKVTDTFDLPAFLKAKHFDARVEGGGAVSHIFLTDVRLADEVVKALAGRDAPRQLHAWRRDLLPSAMHLNHSTRTGDVIVVADAPLALSDVPWYVRLQYRVMGWCCGWSAGAHGYDPNTKEMGAIFFALGRGVAKGVRIREVRQIDVAPTIAQFLGVAPPRDSVGAVVALK